MLAAGGTGGHLFPAEALALELLTRGEEVHLVTDSRAEAFAGRVPGIEIHQVRAGRFGGGAAHAAQALSELASGSLQARRLLRRLAPACVIGFGGYPSVPTMLAAAYLGLPTAIHEQNAVLGRANRLLAPRVRGGSPPAFPRRRAAPCRPPPRGPYRKPGAPGDPRRRATANTSRRTAAARSSCLILGGSQGARIMSEIVPPALAALPTRLREMLRVSQQARPEDLAAVEAIYRGASASRRSCRAFSPTCRRGWRGRIW